MKKELEKIVRLELDGNRIKAQKFVASVQLFFEIIDEIAENTANKRKPVQWIVTVESGSIFVNFKPEALKQNYRIIEPIYETIENGFNLLEKKDKRPKHFNDNVLNNIYRLAKIAEPAKDEGLDKIKIVIKGNSAQITGHTVANIDKILGASYKDYGALEGKLETISERGRPHFVIYDFLTDKPIRCNFIEELTEQTLQAFGKRISVYGLIKYRKSGEPISIDVEEFKVFRSEGDLPAAEEMHGIYKD